MRRERSDHSVGHRANMHLMNVLALYAALIDPVEPIVVTRIFEELAAAEDAQARR